MPSGQTIRAFAQRAESELYGTRDGVWLQTDQNEANDVVRIWGQPRQSITGLAILNDRIVIASGNQLFTGPDDDSANWRELERAAFSPTPANDWNHLRVLFNRFVARSSKGFYTSVDGQRWQQLAPENKRVRAVGTDHQSLWIVASTPDMPGYVLGRSEDLQTWTWSTPLPESFIPLSPIFSVVGEKVAVLAGTYAAPGQSLTDSQALLSFRWPHEGPAQWQIVTHAMPPGGSLIAVDHMIGDAWARLPDGDLAASVNGFDWIRIAKNPLGTANSWFVSGNEHNAVLLLTTNGGRYLTLVPEQIEYAGRGGAHAIAWQATHTSPSPAAAPAPDAVPTSVAAIAQQMLDQQESDAKAVDAVLVRHQPAPPSAPAPASTSPKAELTANEILARDLELYAAENESAGPPREKALAAHRAKWDEKLRYRQLALDLFAAAQLPDDEAGKTRRAQALGAIAKTSGYLFTKTPVYPQNRLQLTSLASVVQNRVPREQHAEILDRVLREVPTLADVWVLRANLHIEAGEWSRAEGALAVARKLSPREPNLEKTETRLDAERPAQTNADLIRQRLARSWQEAETSTDDELRSRDPAADYATGLAFENGQQGNDIKERIDRASFHYLKAALADHIPAMIGYVRVANAHLQQPDLSPATRAALERGIVQWINKAADLGNGEALRVRAQWRMSGQAGLTADRGLGWLELERAAEAGDLVSMRLLIRAAQAGEWQPPAPDTVLQLVKKLAAAGEADAIALLKQHDAQNDLDRRFWGERGAPVADPQAAAAAVPTEPLVIQNAPRGLVGHLQLARPATTVARSQEAARALVIVLLGDERIDAAERAFLSETVKPSFRLRVVAPADDQGPAREVVFIGSYQPQARAFLERFIPPPGSDRPTMTPMMQRYFWVWTGAGGWKKALAHAESSPAGRQEIIEVLQGWLGEKWSASNLANNYGPLRDELATLRNVVAQLTGREHTLARALLFAGCQAMDKAADDKVPDHLYAELKESQPATL